jgi:hypothetical protein
MVDSTSLLTILILSSVWCFGFHAVVKKLILREIFDYDLDEAWSRGYIQELPSGGGIPAWVKSILKPIFACPTCMASVHGTAIFFAFVLGYLPLIMWPVWCICLCGLNFIIQNIIYPEYE